MNWIVAGLKLFPYIVGAVHAVESFTSAPKQGDKKKEAALDGIEAMITAVEIGLDKEIVSQPEFRKLVGNLIDSYVAVQNFIKSYEK